MKTSVVILNYNGERMLREYLPSVLQYSGDAEIVVADNASTDGSVAMLKKDFPQVRVVVLDKNYGFAEGYNRAFVSLTSSPVAEGQDGATPTYYLLLNSDVCVTEHWLTILEEFMDAHPDAAACQPKLRSVAQPDYFEYAGASGGFIDKYGYPFCRGRIFDVVEKDEGQYDDVCEVMWATGAALMIRRADWERAEGFDGSFFAHNEEIDLCWRLRRMGRKIYVVPQSVVYHVGGATLSKSNPKKTLLNFRNNLVMLHKNMPQESRGHVMRIRWFLDYLAAWQTLILNRNLGDFKAIYKARREYKKMKANCQRPMTNDQKIASLCPYSILVKYYLKRKRKYSEL